MVFYKDSILFESTEIAGHTLGASNLAYNPHVRCRARRAPERRARSSRCSAFDARTKAARESALATTSAASF